MKGICVLCNEGNFSIDHVLFECKVLNERRFELYNDIIKVSPETFIKDFESMHELDKLKLMLNGLNIAYNYEWSKIYSAIIKYVYILSINVL